MPEDEKRGWDQLQNLNFDSKAISKRMKKAEGATLRHAHKFLVTRIDNIRSVRRHVIGWLLLVGIMIVAVSVQFSWFRQSYQTVAAADGGTYAEASLGPIETLNPLYASSNAETVASRLLFSSLYSYDSTGHLHGDLAENTQVDPSGTIYTVTLRPHVKWHDGQTLTAKDVAFTVNLIKNPETRSSLRINWRDIQVKAIDDLTVQFQLPAVYAAFPNALTFAILPEHILGTTPPSAIRENNFSRAPIGSGPFVFHLLQSASTANQHKVVHMTASNVYYQGTPLLNRFEIHAYDTQKSIAAALRSGEVSAAADMAGVDPSQIDNHNYTTVMQPVNSGVYALLNTSNPLLKDKALRQALQLATNTQAVRDALPVKVPALSLPFIDGQVAGNDLARPAAANPAQAAALLDGLGWVVKDGVRQKDNQKLILTVATTKNVLYEKALASLVSQWRKLSIGVNTNVVDANDASTNFVQNVLQRRDYDVLLYELSIGADPDVYAYWHSSQIGVGGYNFSNYVNKTADDALASARSRLEIGLRNAKYKSFVRQWVDDVPAIGLYQAVSEYVYNTHVQSINSDAKLVLPYDRYDNVLRWSVNQKQVYKTP